MFEEINWIIYKFKKKVFYKLKLYKSANAYLLKKLKNEFLITDRSYTTTVLPQSKSIPFIIWVMWWQGLDNAPVIIKNNVKNLRNTLGKENVVVLTKDNYARYTKIAPELINKLNSGVIDYTHWSDIVRFHVLRDNGGLWIDSAIAVSPVFLQYYKSKLESNDFFSINRYDVSITSVSQSKWILGVIGGVKEYDLFNYMCKFYEVYFKRHNLLIDYFVTDAAIMHYYKRHPNFQQICESLIKDWHPYWIMQNFDKPYDISYLQKFNGSIDYSVQCLTYKYDKNMLKDKYNLLSHIVRYGMNDR